MANYIRSKKVLKGKANNILELNGFSKAAWSFISSIYKSGWDFLYTNKENNSFRNRISNKFSSKVPKTNVSSSSNKSKDKAAEIIKLSSPKEVLEKYKFFGKEKKLMAIIKKNTYQLYAQAASIKVTNILKLKENYPNLPAEKIENIHRIINDKGKSKPCINMTTKGLSQKQIIVSISKDNTNKFMALSSIHIVNINRAFRNIKSNVMANYFRLEPLGVTIATNKVVSLLDLQVIENYVKNIKNINLEDIETLRLL